MAKWSEERRSEWIQLKVSPAEKEAIKRAAAKRGMGVSEHLRTAGGAETATKKRKA